MPDPVPAGDPPAPDLDFADEFSGDFHNLPIPSMDYFFHNDETLPSEPFPSDLDFAMDFGETGDFEITFDDLDNLCIPSDAEDFLLPDDACNPNFASISPPIADPGDSSPKNSNCGIADSDSPESGASAVSGDSRFFNSDNSGKQDSHNSVDVKASSFPSPGSESFDREESSNGPVSSQGSGDGGSGVYEAMNSPSPDSGRYERDIISSSHHHAAHATIEEKGDVKLEEKVGKVGCDLKRKKEHVHGEENRTTKFKRTPSSVAENKSQQQQQPQCGVNNGSDGDEDEKRKARLMRNRESAQLSRQRKKHYVEELEEKVRSMHSTIADLSSKISFVMAENATLRQQLGAGVMCPPPQAHGMYPHHAPMPPMPYPWVPCAPYVVKPQGSNIPLVPIPRLKPQQPAAASKSSKKNEGKKTEGKAKKVASMSLLGLFLFILLFGGFAPLVDVMFGGLVDDVPGRSSYVSSDGFYGHWNGSERDGEVGFYNGRFGISSHRKDNYERGRILGEEKMDEGKGKDPNGFVHRDNSSEPLVASLYVPRNDKLVKIDGNLIIHSIMASEKAMASQTDEAKKDKGETGLAIPKDWDSALAIPGVGRNRGHHPHVYRVTPEQRRALGSGSAKTLKDHMKSSATDGKMQQWFREGLAGELSFYYYVCPSEFHSIGC